jgi:hypothetical protein
MIERPDPDVLMTGELGQWLGRQSHDRSAIKAKAQRFQMIGIGAACLVAVVVLLWSGGDVWLALQLGFFTGLGGFGIAKLITIPMLNRLKGGINGAIAKALGLDYSVEVTPGRSFELAKQFDLLPSYDNSRFQDLWWGVLGTRPFTLHEARLTEERGSGKNRRTVMVFEGSIMSLGFARMFHGTTVIEEQGERRKFLIGAEKDECEIGGELLARADMVDPRFEDRFTVWTSDQVEARYLVHPEYVERLLALEAAFAGKNARALFRDGELLIVLETGNLFESASLEASEDRALLEQAIAQFGALADLAVLLNERERATLRQPGN